jgi:(p)ppGpp synthase/HD superfamily hydrolase
MTNYSKLRLVLVERLSGMNMFKAVEALNYAESLHDGFRKDKVTPEFQHQLEIAAYILTLHSSIENVETTMAAAFLHDTIEDISHVNQQTIENLFGKEIAEVTFKLAKKGNGFVKTTESYYAELANDPIAAIVKGADRSHNLSTMLGVFSNEKIGQYIEETRGFVLPMLKKARKQFPKQRMVFENIKFVIESHIRPVEFFLNQKQ